MKYKFMLYISQLLALYSLMFCFVWMLQWTEEENRVYSKDPYNCMESQTCNCRYQSLQAIW